jgi:tetratricopeptide (TPR) repeat protein
MLTSSRSVRGRALGALWIAAFLACSGVARPSLAQAQTQEEQDESAALIKARALFQRGLELEQAGNYSAAVQAFREVGQVRMTPQVRYHIALCEERLGRLVAALGGYELALSEADSVNPDFKSEVESNVTRLRESIPRIVIQRGSGADAAVIELDGVKLGDSSVGIELPLDPGPHSVVARAPGYKPLEKTVTVAENSREVAVLDLEALPPDALSGPGGVQTRPIPRVVPYVIGGIGAASLIASGVFYALRQDAIAELEKKCDNHVCPDDDPTIKDTDDSMRTYHYATLITLGSGVALVGTAVVLYALDPRLPEHGRSAKAKSKAQFYPSIGPKTAGGTLVVQF